jgi:hypothetical protein
MPESRKSWIHLFGSSDNNGKVCLGVHLVSGPHYPNKLGLDPKACPMGEKPNGLMGPMATLDISDKRDNPAHEKIPEGTSSETSDEMRNSGGNCERYTVMVDCLVFIRCPFPSILSFFFR